MHTDPADPRRESDPGHLLLDGPAPSPRPVRRVAAFGVAAVLLLTLGAGAGAWGAVAAGAGSPLATSADGPAPGSGTSNGQGGTSDSNGQQGSGGGFGDRRDAGQGTATQGDPASADQIVGVVTIDTQLGFDSAEAAGTGVILTSTGRVLTNNHVIDGATDIRVTDEASGRTYAATVVGTNATRDVAVIQLTGASGLTPATIAAGGAADGDQVTAVGNAGGTGTLTAASGTITDTSRRITTESEGSAAGETLTGLLETDADVVSGDSGGPLKNARGEVVGITTAATSGTSDPTGYAIPIASALSIARQIVAGDDTDEITVGLPAFLGVSLESQQDGAVISAVLPGTAAASTDLAAGDTITALDGRAIRSGNDLAAAIGVNRPGDRVRVVYTAADGTTGTASVVLTEGPAD